MKPRIPTVPKVLQVNRAVAIVILAIQFGFLAALLGGYIDLRQLQESDRKRDFQICVLSTERIQDVVNGILEPIVIPPDALPTLRKALEERNARAAESRERTRKVLAESVKECEVYLTRTLPETGKE